MKNDIKPPKFLYHYTNLAHLQEIIKDKKLKLSPSNLLKPVKPHFENGSFVDETDSYKPVVWFTSELLSGNQSYKMAKNNGLTFEKTQGVIIVPTSMLGFTYAKWDEWAIANGIDRKWFQNLKDTAPGWKNFYISEKEVPITDEVQLHLSEAAMEMLQKNMK